MLPILYGIGLGIIVSINVGPVFLAVTETSIQRGFKSGVLVALGVSVTDIAYVTLILLGFSNFIEDQQVRLAFGLAGGLVLLVFGLRFILKGAKLDKMVPRQKKYANIQYFFKGLVLNGLNPFVGLYWLGILTLVQVQFNLVGKEVVLFFVGMLATIFSFDCLKSWLAESLKYFVEPRMKLIFRVMGAIFVLFGLRLLYDAAEIYINS